MRSWPPPSFNSSFSPYNANCQEISGLRVLSVRDLGTGYDSSQPDQRATLPWSPGNLMITYCLEGAGAPNEVLGAACTSTMIMRRHAPF